MIVLLIGSYNGQDSLGDKCLLRCVVDRIRHAFGKETRIITHVHNVGELHGPLRDLNIEARQGVQSYLWRWQSLIGRIIKDQQILQKISEAQFSIIGRLIMAFLHGGRLALQDLADADAIVIYGGTNFSRQWWWLNTPAYIMSCRWANAPLFLAPQQYGPMESDQLSRFKDQLSTRADGMLYRNSKDFELLGIGKKNDVVVRDEVFSNIRVYPTLDEAQRPFSERESTLLINLRFSKDFLFDHNDEFLDRFCHYVEEVSQRMQLEIKLFCMSGWTFADDLADRQALEDRLNGGERLEVLAYTDEFDFIRDASYARACISMSFHGVILSMIGGCPSIPVTLGDYYDYKYIGFSGYNPANPVPLISLADEIINTRVDSLVTYFEEFESESIWRERHRLNTLVDSAYSKFANSIGM